MLTINLFNQLPEYSFDTFVLRDEDEEEINSVFESALTEELRRRHQARALEEQAYRRQQEKRRQEELFAAQMYQRELEKQRRQRLMYEEEIERRRLLQLQAETIQREMEQKRREALKREMARQMMKKRIEVSNIDKKRMSQNPLSKSMPAASYQIVQGPNGQLFAIESRDSIKDQRNFNPFPGRQTRFKAHPKVVSEPRSFYQRRESSAAIPPLTSVKKNVSEKKNIKLPHVEAIPKKNRILVEVEDASDSECEDEFSDYFRNRRPSMGEWIEPVEFDGIEHMKF